MAYRTLLLVASLLSLAGCGSGDTPVTSSAPAAQRSIVVVVGDATATDVAGELRKGDVTVAEDMSLIGSASLVVIAHDATTGLKTVHQEIAKQVARSGDRKVLWIQTKSSEVDDQELLELVELEARELLNNYNLPGDTIQFAADADSAPVDPDAQNLKGWKAIVRFVQDHSAE